MLIGSTCDILTKSKYIFQEWHKPHIKSVSQFDRGDFAIKNYYKISKKYLNNVSSH